MKTTWQDLVVHRLPSEDKEAHIYYSSDWHIGSPVCDIQGIKAWIKQVDEDPVGYAVLAGDLMNNGLKNSKTNSYAETMPPSKQLDTVYELLKGLAYNGKILCLVPGNHEMRSKKEADVALTKDLAQRLNIEHCYRSPVAFCKLKIGTRTKDPRYGQVYVLCVAHGVTALKTERWASSIAQVDMFVFGHTHEPIFKSKARLCIDHAHNKINTEKYRYVVCSSFQDYGDYALESLYPATSSGDMSMFILKGTYKKIINIFE